MTPLHAESPPAKSDPDFPFGLFAKRRTLRPSIDTVKMLRRIRSRHLRSLLAGRLQR